MYKIKSQLFKFQMKITDGHLVTSTAAFKGIDTFLSLNASLKIKPKAVESQETKEYNSTCKKLPRSHLLWITGMWSYLYLIKELTNTDVILFAIFVYSCKVQLWCPPSAPFPCVFGSAGTTTPTGIMTKCGSTIFLKISLVTAFILIGSKHWSNQ